MNRFHAACLSVFCSLMLSSAFVARPGGLSLAGIAGARALAAGEVKALPDAGWAAVSDVSAANALGAVPAPAPQTVTVMGKNDFPLAPVRDAVLKDGAEGPLSGVICTLLGLTEKNAPLQVKQKKTPDGDIIRLVNVSLKNTGDMILGYRAKDNSYGIFYRTTTTGVLIKALSYKKDQGGAEIPLADAQAGFEKESSFWQGKVTSSGSIASNP